MIGERVCSLRVGRKTGGEAVRSVNSVLGSVSDAEVLFPQRESPLPHETATLIRALGDYRGADAQAAKPDVLSVWWIIVFGGGRGFVSFHQEFGLD